MRRRRRKRTGRQERRRFWLLALPILLLIAVLLLDAAVRPSVYALAQVQAHNTAVTVIHRAAQTVLKEQTDLAASVQVNYGANQTITGITTDTARMNLLKAEISEAIEAAFAAAPTATVRVPLGAATRVVLLSGLGPYLPVRVAYAATAETAFESVFSAAGVNQTLHSVMLHVRAQVTVFLPRGSSVEEIETEFCAAQTVIVGTVPDVNVNK